MRFNIHVRIQSCPTLCHPWTVCSPSRLFCLWNFSGKNTGEGGHFLLQGIFPTQGSNPSLLRLQHWQAGSLPLAPPGKSRRFNICLQILFLPHSATVLLLPCCPRLQEATRCLCTFWHAWPPVIFGKGSGTCLKKPSIIYSR